MFATLVIMALVGAGIGILSGLLGVGGGTIMVPVFRLLFGMSPIASTGTSLFAIIPTSVSGAVSHIRGKTCVVKLGLALGIGGACTSPVGVLLANASPGWAVMLAAAVVVGYSAFTMTKKALAAPKTSGSTAQEQASSNPLPETQAETGGREKREGAHVALGRNDLVKGLIIGAVAGLASGYVGLGGGFIMVPLMVSLLGFPMRLASGTSLLAVAILVTPGAVTQCALGNVDYLAGLAVAFGSVPGAVAGARLVRRVPERALRFAFAGFLGIAAILLVGKEFNLLG